MGSGTPTPHTSTMVHTRWTSSLVTLFQSASSTFVDLSVATMSMHRQTGERAPGTFSLT